jgi:hypothetical protein
MLLKNDFEGVGRAILIQGRHPARNIDSKNSLRGFNSCVLIASSGLFQQHRSWRDELGTIISRPQHFQDPTTCCTAISSCFVPKAAIDMLLGCDVRHSSLREMC